MDGDHIEPARLQLPNRRLGYVEKFQWQGKSWLLSVGFDRRGHCREVFIAGHKSGSEMNSLAIDAAVLMSLCLQLGASPAWLAGRLAVPLPTGRVDGGFELSSLLGKVAQVAAAIEREEGPGILAAYDAAKAPSP